MLHRATSEVVEGLGRALLRHEKNERLRSDLASGALDAQALYREILGLLFRILAASRASAPLSSFNSHAIARGLSLTNADGSLSPLWSMWSADAHASRVGASLAQEDLERAIEQVELISLDLLDADVLGSIYERFLEMHARIDVEARSFSLDTAAGHERKTSGSYYTPASLVDRLLGSALDPALDEAEAAADPEAAILSLTVCDPACGSGRFLVAALRRMAARLAKVRHKTGEPPPDEIARAKADVLKRCIYGVDLSPIAVSLCKLALFTEAREDLCPMHALDGRIRYGNALLGATPELIQKGISDQAFAPIADDDKAVAKRLKKRNASERSSMAPRDSSAMPETATDALNALNERLLADAFCASLFWPHQAGFSEEEAITNACFRRLAESPASASPDLKREITEIAGRYAFFHWHLAFPEVFTDGRAGFDVIVGNPPWGRITVADEEWFARRDPSIARIKGKPQRDLAIRGLAASAPLLYAEYMRAKRDEERLARFFSREIGAFPRTGFRELNTYHLFTELALRLVAPGGRVGLIVKTGIGSADNCLPLFKELVAERRLQSLFDFVNTKPLFPGVQAVERFSLITFRGAAGAPGPIRFAALCRDVAELDAPGRVYALTPDDIALMSPANGACPLLRGERDAEIIRRLYRSFPVLGERDPARPDDLWNPEHAAIFHMSEDSTAFRRHEELLSDGARPIALGRFALGDEEYWPLYEGKYIHLFDHRYGTFEGVPASTRFGRKAEARTPTIERLGDAAYEITPRYWFPKSLWLERAAKRGLRADLHFLYRDITGVYPDHRTAIGAIAPAGPAGNSCPYLTPTLAPTSARTKDGVASARRLLAFAGLFCSIPFDYVVRNRLFSKHINPNVVGQLVMPPPALAVPEEGERGTLRARLCDAALELSYTSESLRPLGELMGVARPYVFDRERRFSRMREIDAIAARLFGLSRDELEHILGSFETLNAAEMRAFKEQRTKSAVLEQYDCITCKYR